MERANRLFSRLVFLLIVLSAFVFFQCDSFFTISPLSALLARDPAYLDKAGKIDYAKAALAARKNDAMNMSLTALELEAPDVTAVMRWAGLEMPEDIVVSEKAPLRGLPQ
jgi:hypothetical protein